MEPVYIVLIVIIIVWVGIFGYMLHLDREIKGLKKKLQRTEKEGNKSA